MSREAPARGRFIVLEGIDGTGKSTVATMLAKRLEEQGRAVHLTCEPTKTWLGDAVRRSWKERCDPMVEVMLFVADRCEHTKRVSERLARGEWVVSDRYADSSCAYQGAYLADGFGGLDKAVEWIAGVNAKVSIAPDLVLLLDADPRTTLARVDGRGERAKYEVEAYLAKVREAYLLAARLRGGVHAVDASKPLADVEAECWKAVARLG